MKTITIKSVLRVAVICLVLACSIRAGAQVYAVKNDLFDVLQGACSNFINVEAIDSFGANPQLHILTQPANGTALVNGNYLSYCPNQNFAGADHFKYSLTSGGQTDSATVYINVQPFNSFVFPGDADQNGKVENFDVLAIGLTYSSTGASRSDSAALNALAWPASAYINTNPGASDCDGNGIVDTLDVLPVSAFYNDTAPFGTHYDVDTSTCGEGPQFYIEAPNGDSIADGDTLQIFINLGNTGSVNKAYGVAFSLNYDTGFIPRGSMRFSTTGSWLMQNDRGLLFAQEPETPGRVDLAVTKTNQRMAQGGGPVLAGIIPIDDNICGVVHPEGWYNLDLSITRIRLIDNYNIVQQVCTQQPSIRVYKTATVIPEPVVTNVEVYPNPANDAITIKAQKIEQVDLTDLAGRKIYSALWNDISLVALNLKGLGIEAGAYLVHVKTATGTGIKKIIVEQ